jgi:thiamine monophosphate synthase
MDLRVFFQKLRKIEQEIAEPHVVVVSEETPDGGRAGQLTEVSRSNAARLILEGHAHLATAAEAAEFHSAARKALEDAQQRMLAEKIQVTVISDADLRPMKNASRAEKR